MKYLGSSERSISRIAKLNSQYKILTGTNIGNNLVRPTFLQDALKPPRRSVDGVCQKAARYISGAWTRIHGDGY